MPDDLSLDEVEDVFGDVRGVVGYPLNVPRGGEAVQRGGDEFRPGLHRGFQLDDDVAVVAVHGIVHGDDPASRRRVDVDEGIHHPPDHLCRQHHHLR